MFFKKSEMPKLAIIVPCFNEQEVIVETVKRLLEVLSELTDLNLISHTSFLYLVDDGSTDKTFEYIKALNQRNKKVKALKFTKNFGNQNAILAGMLQAKELGANCVVSIDADLQQDEDMIKEFLYRYKDGYDIVFGVRKTYKDTGLFKKVTSSMFYKLMNIMGAKTIENHSEYRLVGAKALEILSQYKECNLFLRSVFAEMGLRTIKIPYSIKPRQGGKTKFNFRSLCALAINGITSFSVVPLRFVAVLGVIISILSFLFGLEVVFEKFFLNTTVPGWTTLVVCVCLFSGIQIFCLGIIGEYLGQIFLEVKNRPRYVKDEELT